MYVLYTRERVYKIRSVLHLSPIKFQSQVLIVHTPLPAYLSPSSRSLSVPSSVAWSFK